MKYSAIITYKEKRVLEIEADTEEEAQELAIERIDEAEPLGDDDYEVELEEIDE